MTTDKGHSRRNISNIFSTEKMTVHPLIKYVIYPKEGTKPHYEVSENPHSDHSHGWKDTKHYKDK